MYVKRTRRLATRRRGYAGMGDSGDIMYQVLCDPSSDAYDPTSSVCQGAVTDLTTGQSTGTQSDAVGCLAPANAATAPLDNYVSDLSKNWNPSGYYSPKQVSGIVQQVVAVLNNVASAATQAIAGTGAATSSDDISNLKNAGARVGDAIAGAVPFSNAAAQASSQGITQIDAAGLKRWVVSALETASGSSNDIYVVQCTTPWWVSAFNVIAAAFQAAYGFIKAIVGIAVDLAKDVLKVPDAIGTLIQVAKWGAVAGGAWLLYNELVVKRGKR